MFSSQGLNPHSKWDKKKMQLKDTLENIYANRLPYEDIERMLFNEEFVVFLFNSLIDSLSSSSRCLWRKIPKMITGKAWTTS